MTTIKAIIFDKDGTLHDTENHPVDRGILGEEVP